MHEKIKGKKGIVFASALAIMVILIGIAIASLKEVRQEMLISKSEMDALQYHYYADSGVEASIASLRNGGSRETFGDVDGDAMTDFMTSYNWDTNILTSEGWRESIEPVSTIEATIKERNFTGAIQVFGNIPTVSAATGTIEGHIDVKGTMHPNIYNLVDEDTYSVASDVTSLTVPMPDMGLSGYGSEDNFVPYGLTYHTHSDCMDLTDYDVDVHFITGDCSIETASPPGDIVINGSIIVDGNLTVGPISGGSLTINPPKGTALGNLPAIATSGSALFQNLDSPTFDGLIYSGSNMTFSVISWGPDLGGPLVSLWDLSFTQVRIWQPEFDLDAVNPPYFYGGGGGCAKGSVQVIGWKGHKTPE